MMSNSSLIKFFKYLKYAKKEFIIGLTFIFIGIIAEIYSVKIITQVFDKNLSSIDNNVVFIMSLKLASLYAIYQIIEIFSLYIHNKFLTRAGNILHYRIQRMIYEHIQALPIKYFDDIPAGSVLSKITSDVNNISRFFRSSFITTVVAISKMLFMMPIMLYLDVKLTIVIFLFLPLIILIQQLNSKFLIKYYEKTRKKQSLCSAISNEIMQNLEVVKAYNNEENIFNYWNENALIRRRLDKITLIIESLTLNNILDIIKTLINIIIIAYFTYSSYYNLNWITTATALTFIFYTMKILNQLYQLMFNIIEYTRAKSSAKNLEDLLELETEKNENKKKIKDFRASIEFKNVYFGYNKDEYILKDINLKINENEKVAFIGHTGSGKSTIMNLIFKFYNIDKGHINISNVDINDIDVEFLRSKMAIVLQDSFLFEGTIHSNICEDIEFAKECIERVGAKYIIDERGINAEVLVDATNFSTGEKQLLSFARALARDPKILILDEATSNVDSMTEQKIQKGIEILSQNRTTLIIAHRLSTIKNADKIVVLDKGEIVEVGSHQELMKLNGVYAKMILKDRIK